MKQSPLVSVVIPTHNRPNFLKRTLLSILQQTYENLQIIVVSNGFNPDNRKTVDDLKDSRLEYYEQENSGGPASPRNHGIRKSQGKYIAFCDDDDLWVPEKTQRQVDILEKSADYGLCYSKMRRFDEQKEWVAPNDAGPATFRSLLFTSTVPISSIFMAAPLLKQHGAFSESQQVGTSEDYEFILRHALQTKFYFLDEFLIKYWSGDNRTTCLDFRGNFKEVFTYTKTILNIYAMVYRNSKTSLFSYIKPALFNIKNSVKVVLYIAMKRFGLRR